MNKKENEQLKKIDKLDQQLDNTISKIGVTKVKPIKISRKKLALFMLIPFSIACVITTVTSFLLIDPFHWYTKSSLTLLQQQEKEIDRIKQQFAYLNLASGLDVDNSNTIADLLWELQYHSIINDIVKKPNEIKSITSKKDNTAKLSSDTKGEEVNIKIIVKTGSLIKEIDVKLTVSIDNQKVRQINRLFKYLNSSNEITNEIKTDGINRVSNLIAVIKYVINKNDVYKAVFKDIDFDIINDKDDDEIIASGLKILNVNLKFIETKESINSVVKSNFNLQGKSRKEINQYLAFKLGRMSRYWMSFGNQNITTFFAQTVFANKSTYQDLIDELILFAPENNFYLWKDAFDSLDNSESKISIDFTIEGKTTEELNKQIIIYDDKKWDTIGLKVYFFVGEGEDRSKSLRYDFGHIHIMKEKHVHKDLFLYISKLREVITQGLFKYEFKNNKIGNKYGKLRAELTAEIDRLKENKMESKHINDVNIVVSYNDFVQGDNFVMSKENLRNNRYYFVQIFFKFDRSKFPDSPELNPINSIYIPVE